MTNKKKSGLFDSIKGFLKKHPVLLIVGREKETAEKVFSHLLEKEKRGSEVLVMTSLKGKPNLYLSRSAQPFLLVPNQVPEEKKEKVKEIIKKFPPKGQIIFNGDSEETKELLEVYEEKRFSLGFSEDNSFHISDVAKEGETNFKIGFKGSIIPLWIPSIISKEQIRAVTGALAVATLLDFNLVKMSQYLRKFNLP